MPAITALAKEATLPLTAVGARKSTPGPLLYLRTYVQTERSSGAKYAFVAGLRGGAQDALEPYHLFDPDISVKLVSSKPIPRIWKEDLSIYLWPSYDSMPVGYMTYLRMEAGPLGLALSNDYSPRHYLGYKLASKLPYFMEAVATQHLKTLGFTHVSAGIASPKRRQQLELVGLSVNRKIGGKIEVDEWLRGLGRGIRMAQEKSFGSV